MSILIFNETTAPSTPASQKVAAYCDQADEKIKVLDDQGFTGILSQDGWRDQNRIHNGDFGFAQRQAPTALTSSVALAGGRQFAFDRVFQSNGGGTSVVQTQQVSNLAGAEVGLQAAQYGKFKVITATSKLVVGQVIENGNMAHLVGTKVIVQFKAKYSVAASMAIRLGLAQVTSAGTVDNIGVRTANGFISAFGATGVDPTLTAANNMAYIVPLVAENGSISGSGVDITLTTGWVRYSATFLVPANAKNLVPLIWTNASVVANDELNISEWGLYAGEERRDWHPNDDGDDLIKMLRCFAKTFPLPTAPAQNAGLVGASNGICSLAGAVALAGRCWWELIVPLRRVPVSADVTLYNPSAANALMRNPYVAIPIDMGATAVTANLANDSIEVAATGAATTLVGSVCAIHAAVDVEI
jgi:hypothetical protein